jgi:predicted nucleic acid-binding protein
VRTDDFTTYDASYLAVARALGAALVTAEATLAERGGSELTYRTSGRHQVGVMPHSFCSGA